MSEERDFEPNMPAEEREDLLRLSERLERERPVPGAAFRGRLCRRLLATPRRSTSPGARYRAWAVSYASLGVLCLAVAAIGLAGSGPFAA